MKFRLLLAFTSVLLLLLSACSPKHSEIVVADYGKYNITLNDFEEAYAKWPRKVGKAAARKAYLKLNKEVHTLVLADIDKRYRHNHWPEKRYIPHFSTHLNREGWLDELDQPAGTIGDEYV